MGRKRMGRGGKGRGETGRVEEKLHHCVACVCSPQFASRAKKVKNRPVVNEVRERTPESGFRAVALTGSGGCGLSLAGVGG